MVLILYNTMGRQKQEFIPLRNRSVGLYSCGPTVYHFVHLGNFRAYIFVDVLRRVLERRKYSVKHVMNITDVGHLLQDQDHTKDKIEEAAKKENKSPQEIAEFYTNAFFDDSEKLHLLKHSVVCKATDHIQDMIRLIQKLEKKGFTYITDNGVYFSVEKFQNYGKLSNQSLEEIRGVRETVQRDSDKKHPADFRLWQLNQSSHILQWDSPWGKGYPGWHIECSAMSMKYLGESFDIHTGGMDHIAIHHQNEIAQSEAATGKKYAQFWLHNAFMLFDKNKMSKSLQNIYTLRDIVERGFDPLSFRYLVLMTHYRSEMNFTFDSLTGAQKSLEKWDALIQRLLKWTGNNSVLNVKEKLFESKEKIESFLDDDLNTPMVLAELSKLFHDVNVWLDEERLNKSDVKKIIDFLKSVDQVLSVFDFSVFSFTIPANVIDLAEEREKARRENNWVKADLLRKEVEELGFVVSDSPNGYEIIPKRASG